MQIQIQIQMQIQIQKQKQIQGIEVLELTNRTGLSYSCTEWVFIDVSWVDCTHLDKYISWASCHSFRIVFYSRKRIWCDVMWCDVMWCDVMMRFEQCPFHLPNKPMEQQHVRNTLKPSAQNTHTHTTTTTTQTRTWRCITHTTLHYHLRWC